MSRRHAKRLLSDEKDEVKCKECGGADSSSEESSSITASKETLSESTETLDSDEPEVSTRLTSHQVWEKIKDAIVVLYDEVTLPASGVPTQIVDSDTGFLIGGGYVVVGSESVTIPQNSASIRTPPATQTVGPVRKGRTWVQVFNVNGSGKAYVYETVLVGVDGATGVGVLWIDPCLPWNSGLPEVKNRGLKWGNSREARIGDACYTAGFDLGLDFRAFNKGVIRNNRWTPLNGQVQVESVMVSISLNAGFWGAPIVDRSGSVIAVTANFGVEPSHVSWGSAQVVVQPIIEKLIAAFRSKTGVTDPSVVLVNDPLGPYLIHIKGYLGLSYVVRYDSDFTGGISFPTADACGSVNLSSPEGPAFKRSVGLVITGVDGGGGCNFTSSQTPSPFVGEILPGDLVTNISYCNRKSGCGKKATKSLGDIPPQIAPGNVTFFLLPGDPVTLTYRKRSENYRNVHRITKNVKQYPAEFDSLGLSVAV
jgi:hypothetical protein